MRHNGVIDKSALAQALDSLAISWTDDGLDLWHRMAALGNDSHRYYLL